MNKRIYTNNLRRLPVTAMLFFALILLCGVKISAQSERNGAVNPSTAATQNAAADLRDCAQMLDQSIEETSACQTARAALAAELKKSGERENADASVIESQKQTIEAQRGVIERLTLIKCSTESWFFGLRKKKTCY